MANHTAGFLEREGLLTLPPQLKLKEVSQELRALLWDAVYRSLSQHTSNEPWSGENLVEEPWVTVLRDRHVKHDHRIVDEFSSEARVIYGSLKFLISKLEYPHFFELCEWLLRHPFTPTDFCSDVSAAFVQARATYRVVGGDTISPIGDEIAASTITSAIKDASAAGATGATSHLKQAASRLREGRWNESVRESIHAVESACLVISPTAKTLSDALKATRKFGHIHGSLESAFVKLYGYTNDESGIRHAQVFESTQVDETDAMFMFSACAAFVSYLLGRTISNPAA